MRLHAHLRLWLPSLLPLEDMSDISDVFPSPSPFFPSSLTAFWTGSPLSQASRGLITAVHRKRPSGITTHVIQTIASRALSALTRHYRALALFDTYTYVNSYKSRVSVGITSRLCNHVWSLPRSSSFSHTTSRALP